MPITRRTILKALGIAPAIVAGAATVEAVEAETSDWKPHGDFVEPGHVQTGWFVQTDLHDAGMANWDKVVSYYDRAGDLRQYRITSTGVHIPQRW
jgi:hypothetical protein